MTPFTVERIGAITLSLIALGLVVVLSSRARPSRNAAISGGLLIVGSLLWLAQHNVYEGPVIFGIGSHGIAIADLGAPMWLGIGLAVLRRRKLSR